MITATDFLFFGACWIWNSNFFMFWNFWVFKSLLTIFMGHKPCKLGFLRESGASQEFWISPQWTDFQFFGLVGFEIGKSWFPQNVSSLSQLWSVWGLSEPKSPKTMSSRFIKRKAVPGYFNGWILKNFLRFRAAFMKPENMAGVPLCHFLYDAPYWRCGK